MDWKKITLEEFIEAYNQYPPNWWIRFAYKNFSKENEFKKMKVKRWIVSTLLVLLGLGLIGTILGLPKTYVSIPTMAYSIILLVLFLFLTIARWMNNRRLKKIMRILGVTPYEYNKLVEKHF